MVLTSAGLWNYLILVALLVNITFSFVEDRNKRIFLRKMHLMPQKLAKEQRNRQAGSLNRSVMTPKNLCLFFSISERKTETLFRAVEKNDPLVEVKCRTRYLNLKIT